VEKKNESIAYWSAALVAAAVVLYASVAAGRIVGDKLLAHGLGGPAPPPDLTAHIPAEVIGGQPHAIAVPGESIPVWTGSHESHATGLAPQAAQYRPVVAPAAVPITEPAAPAPAASARKAVVPQPRRTRTALTVRVVVQTLAAPTTSVPVPRIASLPAATMTPTLVPIVQITPADQNLGF
jgi:hypothetical protein